MYLFNVRVMLSLRNVIESEILIMLWFIYTDEKLHRVALWLTDWNDNDAQRLHRVNLYWN